MSRHLATSNWRGCYSACLTICVGVCVGCHRPPVVFQCRLQKLEFLQWHPSMGLFQLSFSSGIPVYTGSTSGIPVYTGPASVHWLRVRGSLDMHMIKLVIWTFLLSRNHFRTRTFDTYVEVTVTVGLSFRFCLIQGFVIIHPHNVVLIWNEWIRYKLIEWVMLGRRGCS